MRRRYTEKATLANCIVLRRKVWSISPHNIPRMKLWPMVMVNIIMQKMHQSV